MDKTRTSSSQNDPTAEYTAFSESTALIDLSHRAILRLTGKDPVGMLNAILTNDVPPKMRLGAYAALLNPKGRVRTDLRVLKNGDDVFVDTGPEGVEAAKEILGRYAPFSRVKMEDLSTADEPWAIIGLYGPQARELLGDLDPAEHEAVRVEIGGFALLVAGVAAPVGGYDVICAPGSLPAVREYLIGAGATPAGSDAYETARISAGIPRFGADITPDNFPGESENFLQRAVSFGKGCYPGQETVARMHYRGSPNKRLHRFELEPGSMGPPEAGDEILQGEKKLAGPVPSVDVVGWLSSVAPLPVDGKVYALGYLSRKADPESSMRARDARVLAVTPA